MWAVVKAAGVYWGGVFAVAFALGVVRTVWLAPRIGALAAVALEVPVVLAASWVAARAVVRRWRLGRAGAAMTGALAFALLMAVEWAMARAMGQSTQSWLAALTTPPGALGLAGQTAFALMPVIVRK